MITAPPETGTANMAMVAVTALTEHGAWWNVMDPNERRLVGHVTTLTIGTTEHARGLQVRVPGITPLGFTGLGPQKPLPNAAASE